MIGIGHRLGALRHSLLARTALALALVGLIPLGLATYRLVEISQQAMSDQVETTHALASRTAAEGVGEFVASRLILAESLASNPGLEDARSEAARILLRENLQAWASLDILAIAVLNAEGEEVIRAQLSESGVRGEVERALALGSDGRVTALAGSRPLLIRLQAPIPGEIGAVAVVCRGNALDQVLEAFELGEDAVRVLIDPQGNVLVGEPEALEGFPRDGLAAAFSDWVAGGVKPDFTRTDTGEEMIGGFAGVAGTDWAVITQQPAEVAYRVSQQMRRQAGLAVAIALLAVAALSTAAYLTLVRPIRQLAGAQRRLAKVGQVTEQGDEIDQLIASFDALERSLGDREALDRVFLGRYQVVEVIGSGAMGTVFRGWDPKLKRPVALKTVRLGRQIDEKKRSELVSQLLREAVTVAQISHPNIVAVFDVEDRKEGAFVAMEYVDGRSLEHQLWRSGKLAPEQVVPLGAAIASGIAAAHDHDIIHRDVKPANILLGDDGAIKVTDFGIAELISAAVPERDVVFGTPGYLPPEALKGQGYGKSGDLFSLGVILYLCLTGTQPFEGRTVKEVIRRTLFSSPDPIRSIEPRAPTELAELIELLMAPEPEQRPGSADLVADRLERLARDLGHHWRPPSDREGPDSAPTGGNEARWMPTTRVSSERTRRTTHKLG